MNTVKDLAARFALLKPRERVLAILALLGVLYFVFDLTLLRPRQAEAKVLRDRIALQQAELAGLNTTLQMLLTSSQDPPAAAKRAELESMRKELALAQTMMARLSSDVRMGAVIRKLTATMPGVTVVSLKTLPVQPITGVALSASGPADAPGAPAQMLYKHGVEVTLAGPYVSLPPYLHALERDAAGVFWGDMKIDVTGYPMATLKLTVYAMTTKPELAL
ncbi:MAG TPA: hypothetical protein VK996_12390 [Ramlibacter sp.]|nr:hypothetical protein [Ramlibacter sp.]